MIFIQHIVWQIRIGLLNIGCVLYIPSQSGSYGSSLCMGEWLKKPTRVGRHAPEITYWAYFKALMEEVEFGHPVDMNHTVFYKCVFGKFVFAKIVF